MSLSDKQFQFAKDVILLLQFAVNKGWKVTIGEVQRTEYQQKKYVKENKSETMDSLHLEKLATDINFFKPIYSAEHQKTVIIDHKLTYKKEDLQQFGDFWESLSPKNEWGGNWIDFQDTPHFQRNK